MLTRAGAVRRLAVIVAMTTAAGAAPACTPEGEEENCEKAVITAVPGKVIDSPEGRVVELSGRLAFEGKPLAGVELSFAYNHRKPDGSIEGFQVGERVTDAQGVAVYRQPIAEYQLGARASGPVTDYRIDLDTSPTVDGVVYCDTETSGPLPLDQLPAP